jgi:DNA-binding protein
VENEIKVKAGGRQNATITYAIALLNGEDGKAKQDTIKITGMGAAIYNAVNVAEILKRRVKGLHQTTDISSQVVKDSYEAVEAGKDGLEVERKVSVITVTLSTKQLDTKHIGYQAPLSEDQVTEQEDRKPGETIRRDRRGGRGGEGSGRGGRGSGRGRGDGERGAFRGGERGSGRGGERGSGRGGERGSGRGGERGSGRGGERGSGRGGERGSGRGGERGSGRGGEGAGRGSGERRDDRRDDRRDGGRGGARGAARGGESAGRGSGRGQN